MKNQFIILVLVVLLGVNNVFAQSISAPVSGTVIGTGSEIQVEYNGSDTVYYTFGGHKPTNTSDYFIGSVVLTVPLFGEPEFARIRPGVDQISDLPGYMSPAHITTEAQSQLLASVEKVNVLWLRVAGCDTCDVIRHYPSHNESGYTVYITADPEELFFDHSAILVEGSGPNIIPLIEVYIDSSGLLSFMEELSDSITTVAINNSHIVWYNQDSIVFEGPFIVCPTGGMPCTFLEFVVVNHGTNSVYVDFGGGETEVFDLIQYSSVGDSSILQLFVSADRVPNFAALSYFNFLDYYPEIDRSKIWKKGTVSIMVEGALIYEENIQLRCTGNSSAFLPQKSLHVDFPSNHKLDYSGIASRSLDKIYLRSLRGGNTLSDMYCRKISSQEKVSTPAGLLASVFLNGEYWGAYNLSESLNKHFMSSMTNGVIDDDETCIYNFSDTLRGGIPLDVHRDSIPVRMGRLKSDLNWLLLADPQAPGFKSSVETRFNLASLETVMYVTAFLTRLDNSEHNGKFFTNNSNSVPYYFFGKDYDEALNCSAVFDDTFYQQMHDTIMDRSGLMMKKVFLKSIENDSILWEYLNRVSDLLNTVLKSENLQSVWSSLTQVGYEHLDRHFSRWGHFDVSAPTASTFYQIIDICVQEFLELRTGIAYGLANNRYGVDTTSVFFSTHSPCGEGYLSVNNMNTLDSGSQQRISFTGIPVPVRADPFLLDSILVNDVVVFDSDFFWVFHPDTVYHIRAYYSCLESDINLVNLRISEVLPDNESVLTDPQGDHEDYIELVNNSNGSVNLAGLYLSDKLSNLMKFRFTDFFDLGPGQHVLFWADNDTADGVFHTNFKLDKDGEAVYLSDGVNIIDSVVWDFTIPEDSSYGICPSGNLQVMEPTPELVNQCQITGIEEQGCLFDWYDQIALYDLLGRRVHGVHLSSGVYIKTYSLKREILFSEKLHVQN